MPVWNNPEKILPHTKAQSDFFEKKYPGSIFKTFLAVNTFLLIFLSSTSLFAGNQLPGNSFEVSGLLGVEQSVEMDSADKDGFLHMASYSDGGKDSDKDKDKDKDKDSDCDKHYWKKHCRHHKRLKVRSLRKLRFGRVIPVRQGAKIIIEPATGNKTVLQGIDVNGRFGPAKFEVRGQPNRRFVVTLPEGTRLKGVTRPGLRVSSYTAFFPPTNTRSRGSSRGRKKSKRDMVGHLGRDGKATLLVGGTLDVRGGRQMGRYRGRFPIYVDYLPR
jgi:hypothetical protein